MENTGALEQLGTFLESRLTPFMAKFVAEGSHFAAGLAVSLIAVACLLMLAITFLRVFPAWLSLHIRQRQLEKVYGDATTPEEKRRALSEHFVDVVDPALGSGFDNPLSKNIRSILYRIGRERQLRLAWTEFKETIVDESTEGEIRNT